ncbi:uncharacterized protein LY89DRAFT_750779 [Mollisia scopiformis]|uniref:Uncharacterized protein n=1 Tax=Mollisia scopiformis TaxID=149040 RepID=A0A194X5J3_MOLSC|nr:uncharacterized protein LY89DRAFT_750779 [Mollisia scopiformis]KUJ15435.1 hypothetical protein LY89DRAFT_750779 [Mollisia scopiformis]
MTQSFLEDMYINFLMRQKIMKYVEDLHATLPINTDDFDMGKLELGSFSMDHISKAIIAYVKHGHSSRQEEAKDTFEFGGIFNIGKPENLPDLKRLFQLYNSAYFNGLLTDYCRIETVEACRISKRTGKKACLSGTCEIFRPGEERNPRYRIKDPYVKITIVQDKTRKCLRTSPEISKRTVKQHTGEGGHHLAWQATAQAIEEADEAGSAMFGFGTDLSRNELMARDMQLGYNHPDDAALRSVGLDIVEILKYRDAYRQEDAERDRLKDKIIFLRGSSCLRAHWAITG